MTWGEIFGILVLMFTVMLYLLGEVDIVPVFLAVLGLISIWIFNIRRMILKILNDNKKT